MRFDSSNGGAVRLPVGESRPFHNREHFGFLFRMRKALRYHILTFLVHETVGPSDLE